jgi:hypothetical protein
MNYEKKRGNFERKCHNRRLATLPKKMNVGALRHPVLGRHNVKLSKHSLPSSQWIQLLRLLDFELQLQLARETIIFKLETNFFRRVLQFLAQCCQQIYNFTMNYAFYWVSESNCARVCGCWSILGAGQMNFNCSLGFIHDSLPHPVN